MENKVVVNMNQDIVMPQLVDDLRQIINEARLHVASTANYTLTMMYWHIGERINREVLGNQRAEYGKQIVSTLSTKLQKEYGSTGFEPRSMSPTMVAEYNRVLVCHAKLPSNRSKNIVSF